MWHPFANAGPARVSPRPGDAGLSRSIMEIHQIFIVLGGLLLIGLVTDELGRRTRFPRVTLLVVFGIAIGPFGLDILPAAFHDFYEFLASAALTMVAFLLGGKFPVTALRNHGREILFVSMAAVVITVVVVGAGLAAFQAPLVMALLLAGMATSTDPAAIQDIVRQTGAKGPFTTTLLGIVALDDAWGLVAFSILLVIAKAISGDGMLQVFSLGLWEFGGALAVGAAVGFPAAFLTGRIQPGEPMQAEALGVVFLCAGLAIWLDVSFLLAGMVAGTIVVNLAKHHSRPFHEIEKIEWPFMVLFFILSGASLHVESLSQIGLLGIAYIVLRTAARLLGGWIGVIAADGPAGHRQWMGLALIPQAGVALGMALVAANQFPEYAEPLLAVVIGTTVVFELVGPPLTLIALRKLGEAR